MKGHKLCLEKPAMRFEVSYIQLAFALPQCKFSTLCTCFRHFCHKIVYISCIYSISYFVHVHSVVQEKHTNIK